MSDSAPPEPLRTLDASRQIAHAVMCIGAVHYLFSVALWALCLYAFGISRHTYAFWVRDAVPALLMLFTYLVCLSKSRSRPWFTIGSAVVLVSLSVGHFLIDNWLHHFTITWMTTDSGCIWSSPTWWWFEHQCGDWWHP